MHQQIHLPISLIVKIYVAHIRDFSESAELHKSLYTFINPLLITFLCTQKGFIKLLHASTRMRQFCIINFYYSFKNR